LFECSQCGRSDEKFLSIKSDPRELHECPGCRKRTMVRQIGAGSGFTGVRGQYPYKAWTLPWKKDSRGLPKEPLVIESAKHEREVMAGAYNGERYEKNQL